MTDGAFTISIVPETSGNERVNSACRHMNVWSFDLTAQEAFCSRQTQEKQRHSSAQ